MPHPSRRREGLRAGPLPKLFAGGAALALLTVTTDAVAQDVPSPYEFFDHRYEVSLGLQHWQASEGEFDLGPSAGTGPAARVGFHLTGPFALEGLASLVPSSRSVVEPRSPDEDNGGPQAVGESSALLANAELRVRFHVTGNRTWNGLTPYVMAGAGIVNDFRGEQEDDLELEGRDRFSFGPSVTLSGGIGNQWFAGDRLVVQTDLGLTFWRMSNPAGFRDLEGEGFDSVDENEWVVNPSLTVSLGLRR